MRYFSFSLVVLLVSSLGCRATGTPVNTSPPPQEGAPAGGAAPEEPKPEATGPRLTPPEKVPAERRVWAYVDGQRRLMDVDDARSLGLTVVDLSDDWVPYIFWSQTPGKEDYEPNEYLDTYADLANDRIDVDGVKLDKHERNYLEVYGIQPSIGVIRRRFVQDEERPCFKDLDYQTFKEYHDAIRVVDPAGSERELKQYYGARSNFQQARKKARGKTLEQLLQDKKYKGVAERWQRYDWRHRAINGMQKRMACEGMYDSPKAPSFKPGIISWATREALRRYERKHNVYGRGMMFKDTVEALSRTARENNFESLRRALTERVVTAAGILEDGTIRKATFKDASGHKAPVRNLVQEFSDALLAQLGLTDADKALAFVGQYSEKDFEHLWVAVKLPPLPEYYSDNMDLKVIIDRGDIWYDFPNKFQNGRLVHQPRGRFPHLTLYVNHADQKIPLVRWRTTVGSWQPEMRHGEEYFKYKISDVGPRIWKNIVAGPVWVPPTQTPSDDLVKVRAVRGRSERIVAHNSFGPGYASAYGLVAAFHVTEAGNDNQVRTHGSVNYMSINSSSGFSHGCHRLHNYRAVRIFSFVLRHRPFVRKGQSKFGYQQRYEHLGEEFQMDLTTRGYYYEMDPPVPVNVLEGNIRGEKQQPVEEYVKKPTVVYQDDLPSLERKSPAGAPRVTPKKPKEGMMSQPQNL